MSDISLNRICSDCKDEIIIRKDNIEEVVLYDGAYYHKDCFIHMCNEKLQSKRCKKIKWQSAIDGLDMLIKDAKFKLNKEFDIEYKKKVAANRNSTEQKTAKNDIYNFMLEQYSASSIPQYIFIKLNSIYSGTFRGMSTGILPTELLDMWQRKIDYLNRIANRNVTKGKPMDSIQRINYDLSVLINKYDSYKEWKRKQEILEQEHKEQALEKPIVTIGNIQNEKTEKNTDDISDLVDDIFG